MRKRPGCSGGVAKGDIEEDVCSVARRRADDALPHVTWVAPPLKPGETPEMQSQRAREALVELVRASVARWLSSWTIFGSPEPPDVRTIYFRHGPGTIKFATNPASRLPDGRPAQSRAARGQVSPAPRQLAAGLREPNFLGASPEPCVAWTSRALSRSTKGVAGWNLSIGTRCRRPG